MKHSFTAHLQRFFARPSPREMAQTELVDAEHELLEALTGIGWAQALVEYNTARIARLKAYLNAA